MGLAPHVFKLQASPGLSNEICPSCDNQFNIPTARPKHYQSPTAILGYRLLLPWFLLSVSTHQIHELSSDYLPYTCSSYKTGTTINPAPSLIRNNAHHLYVPRVSI